MDLLMTSHCKNSHYVYIKGFNKLVYNKTEHKDKKRFLQILLVVLQERENINRA